MTKFFTEKLNQISKLFMDHDGKLTQDLVKKPAKYGLGLLPSKLSPDRSTTAICGFCSTGCGLNIHLKKGRAINLSPDSQYPVNSGMACPKGWEALKPLEAKNRARFPMMKGPGGNWKRISWDQALNEFCKRFKAIAKKYGPEANAFLSTGQIPTEEMFLLGSLAKFGMGMVHGDGNTRQCMATAAVAYKKAFGFDAPPYSYKDFEESDLIILIGSNLCISHPIMWQRICKNRKNAKIIVIDPRKTETARSAHRHYAIKSKGDLPLFYGLANQLIKRGFVDQDFIDKNTNGFQGFEAFVKQFDLETSSQGSGLREDQIVELAEFIGAGKAVSFWWTMGINQSHEGVLAATSIINLALMTGNIGRPGTGANSITGQCNAMGSRIFSNTTNLFGGRSFESEKDRKKVAKILGINSDQIPTNVGHSYHEIFEKILEGKIKGLWVIATNPGHSWINRSDLPRILENLEFLVVQDMYNNTETVAFSDLILPAAGWGEKEGTFINSERRIGLLKKVAKAPGEALADFYIFKLIAQYWGLGEWFKDYNSPSEVFEILQKLSQDRPCDFSGIKDYQEIDEKGGIQWPFPKDKKNTVFEKERRLFEDGAFYHPDAKAQFFFGKPRSIPERLSKEYPLRLLTGRGSVSQWHTRTRTKQSKILNQLAPKNCYIEIHPEDANLRAIKQGQKLWVTSARGKIRSTAYITPNTQKGHVFMPMHYKECNILTFPSFDPYSKQPSYKASAVNIEALKTWEEE